MLELEIRFNLNHARDCGRQAGNPDTCRFYDPLIILHCHRDAPFNDPAGSACLPRPRPNLSSSTVLESLLLAISKAEAPMTHVIKNAVRGNRAPGGVPASFGVAAIHVSGPHTRKANRASIPVSMRAAARGKIENRTPRPQATCQFHRILSRHLRFEEQRSRPES